MILLDISHNISPFFKYKEPTVAGPLLPVFSSKYVSKTTVAGNGTHPIGKKFDCYLFLLLNNRQEEEKQEWLYLDRTSKEISLGQSNGIVQFALTLLQKFFANQLRVWPAIMRRVRHATRRF